MKYEDWYQIENDMNKIGKVHLLWDALEYETQAIQERTIPKTRRDVARRKAINRIIYWFNEPVQKWDLLEHRLSYCIVQALKERLQKL